MLKKFTGYKGKAAAGEVGGVTFVLLAKDKKHLAALWQIILPDVPLDPSEINNAILISSGTLPLTPLPTSVTAHVDAIDRVESEPESASKES